MNMSTVITGHVGQSEVSYHTVFSIDKLLLEIMAGWLRQVLTELVED